MSMGKMASIVTCPHIHPHRHGALNGSGRNTSSLNSTVSHTHGRLIIHEVFGRFLCMQRSGGCWQESRGSKCDQCRTAQVRVTGMYSAANQNIRSQNTPHSCHRIATAPTSMSSRGRPRREMRFAMLLYRSYPVIKRSRFTLSMGCAICPGAITDRNGRFHSLVWRTLVVKQLHWCARLLLWNDLNTRHTLKTHHVCPTYLDMALAQLV